MPLLTGCAAANYHNHERSDLFQVEQFWRFYSHMIRPGDLTGHSDFHLFKEGIKPMWEVCTLATRFNDLFKECVWIL